MECILNASHGQTQQMLPHDESLRTQEPELPSILMQNCEY